MSQILLIGGASVTVCRLDTQQCNTWIVHLKTDGAKDIQTQIKPVADPGGGARGPWPPLACKNRPKKRWPLCVVAYISCFLAPLSEVSGSATGNYCFFLNVMYYSLKGLLYIIEDSDCYSVFCEN